MSPRMRRTAALAGGAAVLAFGAYTVGSQAGDGVAQSAGGGPGGGAVVAYGGGPGGPPPGPGGPGRPGGPGGAGLSDLAKQLGVKEADLRAALQKLRQAQQPPRPGDKRDELAQKLADKLKVDKADVQKALDEIRKEEEAEHEKRRNEFAAALAKELGISADKVKDALPAGPPHHGRRGP
jgi:hypothetical protein